MEYGHLFVQGVIGICLIILVSCLIYLFSNKFKSIPYTVLLLLFGLIISPLNIESLELIRLSPESVMYIFLPALLFESAFNFEFREFKKIITPSFAIASIGLLVSSFVIALPLNLIFGIDFKAALLFGSVISSTDPIAVLAIFKQLGVPRRLQLLVDAESFLNDATSVICFRILLPVVITATEFTSTDLLTGMGNFIFVLFGGIFVGAIFGLVFSFLLSKIKNLSSVEIALTIILAHSVFIFADDFLKVSGIIAVLTSGLVLGNYGRTKISPSVTHNMHQTWDFLAFLCTSCVFLLIGYEISMQNLLEQFDIVVLGVLAMLIGRAISTYGIGFIYNLSVRSKNKIPLSWLHVVNWGGLRGALPLIILLSLPNDFQYKSIFIQITFGAILFTLLINALSIPYLIKFLKLDRLDTSNQIEIKITELIALKKVAIKLNKLLETGEICKDIYKKHEEEVYTAISKIKTEIDEWVNDQGEKQYQKEFVKVLKRNCLNIESHYYYTLFSTEIISEPVFKKLKIAIENQIDKINQNSKQFDLDSKDVNEQIESFKKKNNMILKFIGNLFLGEKVDEIGEFYMYKKVRMLANKRVLKQIDDFKQFNTSKLFNEVIIEIEDMYNKLLSKNLNTLAEIEKNHKDIVFIVEENLVNAETKVLVNKVVEELGEQGRISTKTLQSLQN